MDYTSFCLMYEITWAILTVKFQAGVFFGACFCSVSRVEKGRNKRMLCVVVKKENMLEN